MGNLVKNDSWVWVIVKDPERDEQFLGQYDKEKDESYIPVFLTKSAAQQCLAFLALEKGHKYEAQAVLLGDIPDWVGYETDFSLFILNESGEILERIKM